MNKKTNKEKMTRYYLVLQNTQSVGKKFLLPDKGNIYVGRDSSCQIYIDDPRLSRKHCQIFVDGGVVVLKDMNSSNGTFINQDRITTSVVHVGDTIYFGKIIFQLIIEGEKKKDTLNDWLDNDSEKTAVIDSLIYDDDFGMDETEPKKEQKIFNSSELLSSIDDKIHLHPNNNPIDEGDVFVATGQVTEELLSLGSMRKRASENPELNKLLNKNLSENLHYQQSNKMLDDEDALIGSSFLSYKIIEHIGDGPIARVFKVEHEIMHQFFVLKIFEKEIIEHPSVLRLFENQLKINSNLMFPGLVEIVNAGYHDGDYYILTNFIDDFDLNIHITDKGALPFKDTLPMIKQMMQILESLHSRNIFHGGIKPTNILRNKKGKWFISDIGLTSMLVRVNLFEKVNLDERDLAFDMSFFAPETINQRIFLAESDIYSLGAIWYYALTGEPPFEANDIYEMKEKVANSIPKPLGLFTKDAPVDISEIIAKAMSKDINNRYQAISDFRFAINSIKL